MNGGGAGSAGERWGQQVNLAPTSTDVLPFLVPRAIGRVRSSGPTIYTK